MLNPCDTGHILTVRDLLPEELDRHFPFMQIAMEQAKEAAREDEVPIGAVLTDSSGTILSKSGNQTIFRHDPTAHAEILVIREACAAVGNYRLLNTTLYVTVEPCVMCMAAAIHARIATIVFGTGDPRWGGCVSLYRLADDHRFNHRPRVICGIFEAECRTMMQNFFRARR